VGVGIDEPGTQVSPSRVDDPLRTVRGGLVVSSTEAMKPSFMMTDEPSSTLLVKTLTIFPLTMTVSGLVLPLTTLRSFFRVPGLITLVFFSADFLYLLEKGPLRKVLL
jgi:hypothetical protein